MLTLAMPTLKRTIILPIIIPIKRMLILTSKSPMTLMQILIKIILVRMILRSHHLIRISNSPRIPAHPARSQMINQVLHLLQTMIGRSNHPAANLAQLPQAAVNHLPQVLALLLMITSKKIAVTHIEQRLFSLDLGFFHHLFNLIPGNRIMVVFCQILQSFGI